eukprot:6766245-Karenia_brevis.AAC.1
MPMLMPGSRSMNLPPQYLDDLRVGSTIVTSKHGPCTIPGPANDGTNQASYLVLCELPRGA